MTMVQRLNLHAELMTRMAEAVHADLGEALIQGELSGEELRGAVLRCTTCEATDACAQWVETPVADAAVPGFCVNRDLMERLRA